MPDARAAAVPPGAAPPAPDLPVPDTPTAVPPKAVTPARVHRLLKEFADAGEFRRLYPHPAPGRLDPVVLRELLAAADAEGALGPVLSLCVHLASAVPLLAAGSRSKTTAACLEAALRGERLVALAATDEGAGSDLAALTTTVRTRPDGLVVDGTKRWVTSATTAGDALVLARRSPGRHFTNFTWVLVPLDAPGVTAEPADTELFAGSGVGHLRFSDVRLTTDHLVGRQGRGMAAFAQHIAVERLASAGWAIDLCRRIIADTDRRLGSRIVEDTALRRRSGVRQRLAECAVRVAGLHALWTQLRDRIADERDGTAAALLKAASGATVDHVLAECARLQGADGFARGGAQALRAEAAIFGIGGGTTEVTLDIVAERLDAVLDGLTP
ncbi:acyl-CoA dehydrogenase [Streptomyces sp. NBC_00669]|uniref:acyl-CoA dehydrogenase family protein n=1 Tax=Streptomyces sp. NBC_00669 TaxID=2976011 RepID=UPI002E357A38|nr:acyl-CoA dehydrogenase [Streptomyces sp. NBC_00669]